MVMKDSVCPMCPLCLWLSVCVCVLRKLQYGADTRRLMRGPRVRLDM